MLAILVPSALFAQDSIPVKKKFSPFVYTDEESEITYDLSISTGFANGGAAVSARAQIDIYHILLGYGVDAGAKSEPFFMQSLHGGYRYRTQKIRLALMSGYSWIREKDYYGEKEITDAFPLELQFDFIISNSFGVGISGRNVFIPGKDIASLLFGIRFGNLRTIY